MFYRFKCFLLKKLYKLFIYKIIVLPKKELLAYSKLETYLKIYLNSNRGVFTFNFKKDRRRTRRKRDLLVKYFVVELEIPNELHSELKNDDLINKVLVVIKINILPIDYNILAEILIDLYIDNFYKKYE